MAVPSLTLEIQPNPLRVIPQAPVVSKDLTGFQEGARMLPTGKINNTSVLTKKGSEVSSKLRKSYLKARDRSPSSNDRCYLL